MDYEKAYKDALNRAKHALDCHNQGMVSTDISLITSMFPELKEPEEEKIREIIRLALESCNTGKGYIVCDDNYAKCLAWLEKQGESSDQIRYWTEEEIEPIISDYLRGAEHYGGMIARLRCLKPKSLEKQGETYIKRDVDDAWLKGMCDAKQELEKQSEQNSSWSKEDDVRLQACIDALQAESLMGKVDTVMTKWLKSFKTRYTWKPSDEQMEALDDFIYAKYPNIEKYGAAVKSLYQDLKKLKGE